MQQSILGVSPLLMGMALLMVGNGSLPTIIALRLATAGEPTWLIGLVMAQYYVGIVIGTFYSHKLIFTVGHIRAFATFGSTMSAVTLLHAFIVDPWAWAIFRFLVGACMVGMFMCVESWLNERSDNSNRGQIFSLYVIAIYFFQGIGQFLIQLPDTTGFTIYVVVSVLMSLSIVPVAVTRVPAPELPETSHFDFARLWRISPTGMIVSLVSGVIMGAFYGIGPIFAQLSGMDRSDIAIFMSAVILGGLVLQWPLGKFSDGRDRREFILIINILLVGVSLLMALSSIQDMRLIILATVFGALSCSLYPLSVAYTNDYLGREDLVPAAGGLVMAHGIGAIAGPPMASLCIDIIGTAGLFVFIAFVATGTASLIFWRIRLREGPSLKDQVEFQVMPRTSPLAGVIDPRGEFDDAL